MNNQIFSWRRFGLALKAYLVEGKSQLALSMGVLWGILIFTAVKFAQSAPTYRGYGSDFTVAAEEGMSFFSIYALAAVLMGSWMFGTLSTKPKRINTLMLPASALEKFLVRWCIYVVLFSVTFVVGALVADGIRALCTPAETDYCSLPSFVIQQGWHEIINDNGAPLWVYWWAILNVALIGQALYSLGSVIWPKRSAIKTFVALFALSFVFLFTVPSWEPALFKNLTVGSIIVLETAFIIVLYIVTYLLFRRVQVSQRFMN